MIYCEDCGAVLTMDDKCFEDVKTGETICGYCFQNRMVEAVNSGDTDWLKLNMPELLDKE